MDAPHDYAAIVKRILYDYAQYKFRRCIGGWVQAT